jgi:hypothetical protein
LAHAGRLRFAANARPSGSMLQLSVFQRAGPQRRFSRIFNDLHQPSNLLQGTHHHRQQGVALAESFLRRVFKERVLVIGGQLDDQCAVLRKTASRCVGLLPAHEDSVMRKESRIRLDRVAKGALSSMMQASASTDPASSSRYCDDATLIRRVSHQQNVSTNQKPLISHWLQSYSLLATHKLDSSYTNAQ